MALVNNDIKISSLDNIDKLKQDFIDRGCSHAVSFYCYLDVSANYPTNNLDKITNIINSFALDVPSEIKITKTSNLDSRIEKANIGFVTLDGFSRNWIGEIDNKLLDNIKINFNYLNYKTNNKIVVTLIGDETINNKELDELIDKLNIGSNIKIQKLIKVDNGLNRGNRKLEVKLEEN